MSNLYDAAESINTTSLESLLRLTAKEFENIDKIVVPEGIARSYFFTRLGDGYIDYASRSDNKDREKLIQEAKRCFLEALSDVPKYARGEFEREQIELRLEYLNANFINAN